ncbi:hypothetical protein F5B17DRAFT_450799 [Nemania serpens]|nr:hypothetical protein F5B17DRAFT_450799 [Nemania serpens]
MAAAAVAHFVSVAGTNTESAQPQTSPSTTQALLWTELDLSTRLAFISRQWLVQKTTHESNRVNQLRQAVIYKPLTIPDPTPKRSRRLPSFRDEKLLIFGDIVDLTQADERPQQRASNPFEVEGCPAIPPNPPRQQGRQKDSLFSPFLPESHCDLSSEHGFIQHGKKKKKGNQQPLNSHAPEKKDDGGGTSGGADGGADGSSNQNGDAGDTGGGAPGKGDGDDKKNDKKDDKKEDKKDETKDDKDDKKDGADDPSPDDAWGAFATTSKKKKKGKGQAGESTDLLGTETKFDAFDDIKLNDTGPSLDLDFGSSAPDTKTSSFSAWGTSWITGASGDGSGAQVADKVEDKEEKKDDLDADFWGLDQPKTKPKKNKTSFGFGSFDETEEKKEEPLIPDVKPEEKKDDDIGFGFAAAGKKEKKKKKTNIWDPEPEEEKKESPVETQDIGSAVVEDGWGATTKKGKKGTTTLLDLTPAPAKIELANDTLANTGSKSAKKKKGMLEETTESDPSVPEPAAEPPSEDPWGNSWGTTKKEKDKDKKKKEKTADSKSTKEDKSASDDLSNGMSTSKKVKKKKGVLVEEPVKEPEPEPQPEPEPVQEPEPEPAPAPAPAPEPPKSVPVVAEPTSAWSFWGAAKKSSKKAIEQSPPEIASIVENIGDSWLGWAKKKSAKSSTSQLELDKIPETKPAATTAHASGETGSGDDFWDAVDTNGTKKNPNDNLIPDTSEEPKEDDAGWGWSKKNSPPPAPTPPPLDMDRAGFEMDTNVWAEPQAGIEEDTAAAEIAAQVAAEEQELSDLTIKSLKKRLRKKDQERFDELTNNANRRAEEAAAKEAEKSRLEAEASAAAALQAEENATAEALKLEIEAEETELELLQAKLKKRGKLGTKDQKRFDELTEKMKARATVATEPDTPVDNGDVQGAVEDEQATREADEQAAREADEAATREAKAQAEARREAEGAAADEAELESLKTMKATKKKMLRKDQKRLDELAEKMNARAAAAAAAEADTEAANRDAQAAIEAEELAAREAEERAAREAEEQEAREMAEKAAREAEEEAAKEAEEKAAREAEEEAAREAEEREAREAEEQAAREAKEAAADEAEFEALEMRATRKKLSKKDQKRFDELAERINARAGTADADEAATQAAAEQQAAREAEEQATREAAELAAREAEEQAARKAEEQAARQAEADADEAELEVLQAKLKKRKKLNGKDQGRFDELTERINARAAAASTSEPDDDDTQALVEAAEQAAREAEEAALRGADEQAARDAEEAAQAAREAEDRAERERQAAEAATSSKKKSKKSTKADDKKSKSTSKNKKKDDDDFSLDGVDLTAEQADEILSGLPPPRKPKTEDPFAFWGAKPSSKSSPPESVTTTQPQHSAATETRIAEPAEVSEATEEDIDDGIDDGIDDDIDDDIDDEIDDDAKAKANEEKQEHAPTFFKSIFDDWIPGRTKGTKLTEKLRKFEPNLQDASEGDLIDVVPEAPAAPPAEPETNQGDIDIVPGSFPDEDHGAEFYADADEGHGTKGEGQVDGVRDMALAEREAEESISKEVGDGEDEDEIVEIIDLSPPVEKKRKKSKKSKYKDSALPPVPPAVPPPPPAVPEAPEAPDAPTSPLAESRSSKKERAKVNRDGNVSWGVWSASATPHKEDKNPPRSRSDAKKPKEREERVPFKSPGLDKVERQDRRTTPIPKPRMSSVFQSIPPISRSMSTRDKRADKSSSRRQSDMSMSGGLVSPPPEEMPEYGSKAARVLGVDRGHSRRTSRNRAIVEEDDDIMIGSRDLPSSPDKSARKRSKAKAHQRYSSPDLDDSKQAKPDDDVFMGNTRGPIDLTPPRRSNSNAKKGISGIFGGLRSSNPRFEPRSEPRPEPRRRSTYHGTEDEGRPDKRPRPSRGMSNMEPETDDREARRAARRAAREQEKAEEARRAREKDARRERRRRQEEEEEEARRQEEREARRAERRAAREREAQRLADEEAEARETEKAERRRRRRLEKEAAAVEAEAEARRAARAERRRPRYTEAYEDEEEERRRRRDARRAEKASHDRSIPVDNPVYPRERSSRPTDDEHSKRRTPTWPHSGTSSWVKEHSDAGPPPPDHRPTTEAHRPVDDEEARRAARRAARRREKERYEDMNRGDVNREYEDDQRRRRARREERERRERPAGGSGGSAGSGEKAQREQVFMDATPRSSWWRKLTGS